MTTGQSHATAVQHSDLDEPRLSSTWAQLELGHSVLYDVPQMSLTVFLGISIGSAQPRLIVNPRASGEESVHKSCPALVIGH